MTMFFEKRKLWADLWHDLCKVTDEQQGNDRPLYYDLGCC